MDGRMKNNYILTFLSTIVKIHGGPETQSRPQFDALTQIFTHAGFAVAVPNIRGSSGYGKNYLNADNQEKRMDAITDIKELAVHLPQTHAVDKSRLVVMGMLYFACSCHILQVVPMVVMPH